MRRPFAFARANAGKSIDANIAMMAITTSNSIKVNARPNDLTAKTWRAGEVTLAPSALVRQSS
ncbi:hypothetical protein SBV1_350013 [Verrucomicrobia bacterium]|nr:hypothetical protein SBV1_350013 [Verrucomicrobiota bacterium]